MATKRADWYKKWAIITAVVLIALLYFFVDARVYPFPKCPFYSITHLYCPGCGSQRALSALLHGHVADAFHDNILMVSFLPILSYAFFVNFRSNGKETVSIFYKVSFGRAVLAIVIGFWVFRNIPVYPFSILAPLN